LARALVATGIILAGLVFGAFAEVSSWGEREPVLERGVIFAGALIISGLLAVAAYVMLPRSK